MIELNEDLQDFQKKVFAEYKTVKSLKESTERIKKDRQQNRKGCLMVLPLMFAEWAINKASKSESYKKNYFANEREADELLKQKEIFERICETVANVSRTEILTEEKFVNELTAALYRSDLASRFVVPENAVLYAMMWTKIFNAGLENFCRDRQTDE